MLDALLDAGYEQAFVANADNLGAVLEPRIAAWVARERIPFVMEVADRTEADKKGGHLARRRGGGLVLREIAADAGRGPRRVPGHRRATGSSTRTTCGSTCGRCDDVLRERDGVLGLPMIVNRKTVDPGDKGSPEVVQLESAMGAAIAVFDGARALRVPRSRFLPVKTTDDLLALRSDAYVLDEAARVRLAPERGDAGAPLVAARPRALQAAARLRRALPRAARRRWCACERLQVDGDVTFGADVVVRGTVRVEGPARIADGTVLDG